MIVGELRGVNVDVAVPVDSFDNLPLYLVFRFLEQKKQNKKKLLQFMTNVSLCQDLQ